MFRQLEVHIIEYLKSKTKVISKNIYHCYYELYMAQ